MTPMNPEDVLEREGWTLFEKVYRDTGLVSYRYKDGGAIWKYGPYWRWRLEELEHFQGEKGSPDAAAEMVEFAKAGKLKDVTFTIEVHALGIDLDEAYESLSQRVGGPQVFNPIKAYCNGDIPYGRFVNTVVAHRRAHGMCDKGIHCEGCERCRPQGEADGTRDA